MEREIAAEFLEMLKVGKKQSHQGVDGFSAYRAKTRPLRVPDSG